MRVLEIQNGDSVLKKIGLKNWYDFYDVLNISKHIFAIFWI